MHENQSLRLLVATLMNQINQYNRVYQAQKEHQKWQQTSCKQFIRKILKAFSKTMLTSNNSRLLTRSILKLKIKLHIAHLSYRNFLLEKDSMFLKWQLWIRTSHSWSLIKSIKSIAILRRSHTAQINQEKDMHQFLMEQWSIQLWILGHIPTCFIMTLLLKMTM